MQLDPVISSFASSLNEAARAWFGDALGRARLGHTDEVLTRWSGCGRRLGRAPQGKVAELGAVAWDADELGRALLLLTAAQHLAPEQVAALVDELFRTGEMREQQALLKALPHLPEPERYVHLATEAVRRNELSVLEAITCDNTFPAAHLPDLAFNQMVMKAIFNGLPLARVAGLATRRNPELVRMVAAYASERRAAGRSVPPDVDLILEGVTHAPV